WLIRTVSRHYFSGASPSAARPPQVHLPYSDARWWVVPSYDDLLVTNAEGSAVTLHRRDRALFRAGMWRSIRNFRRIRNEWSTLSARYRSALDDLTSVESWRRVFDAD
ncbi:MAG TPA: glycosyltransferase family 2 protein, partial [Naasia sp.]